MADNFWKFLKTAKGPTSQKPQHEGSAPGVLTTGEARCPVYGRVEGLWMDSAGLLREGGFGCGCGVVVRDRCCCPASGTPRTGRTRRSDLGGKKSDRVAGAQEALRGAGRAGGTSRGTSHRVPRERVQASFCCGTTAVISDSRHVCPPVPA